MSDALLVEGKSTAIGSAGRTFILSDTHLGVGCRGAGSAAALRPLWAGADRVIFNGDTVEMRTSAMRALAPRHLDDLHRFAEEDGVELAFIAGNHDPFVSEVDWLTLGGGAVVVTHGDLLHPEVPPWSHLGGDANETARREAVRAWRGDQLARFESNDQHAWQRWQRRLRKITRVSHYWREFPGRAQRFAAEQFPGCRFFIFGHIHRPGAWGGLDSTNAPSGVVALNTGSFTMPRRPRAVVLEADELTMHKVRYDHRRGHRLVETPQHRFKLDLPDASSKR